MLGGAASAAAEDNEAARATWLRLPAVPTTASSDAAAYFARTDAWWNNAATTLVYTEPATVAGVNVEGFDKKRPAHKNWKARGDARRTADDGKRLAQLLLADRYEASGDWNKALRALDTCVESLGGAADAGLAVRRAHAAFGTWLQHYAWAAHETALPLFEHALVAARAAARNPLFPDAARDVAAESVPGLLLEAAVLYVGCGKRGDGGALSLLSTLIRGHATWDRLGEAVLLAASAMRHEGALDEAADYLDWLVETDPAPEPPGGGGGAGAGAGAGDGDTDNDNDDANDNDDTNDNLDDSTPPATPAPLADPGVPVHHVQLVRAAVMTSLRDYVAAMAALEEGHRSACQLEKLWLATRPPDAAAPTLVVAKLTPTEWYNNAHVWREAGAAFAAARQPLLAVEGFSQAVLRGERAPRTLRSLAQAQHAVQDHAACLSTLDRLMHADGFNLGHREDAVRWAPAEWGPRLEKEERLIRQAQNGVRVWRSRKLVALMLEERERDKVHKAKHAERLLEFFMFKEKELEGRMWRYWCKYVAAEKAEKAVAATAIQNRQRVRT